MKLPKTRRSTAKAVAPTSSSVLTMKNQPQETAENVSSSQGENQSSLFASECRRLYEIRLLDFIRGDSHLPERYVFDIDLFPDYCRGTQRRLVELIQAVCVAQRSPIAVHQWANEEHDDRTIRRIRFRCAFFRKKRKNNQRSCGFQFQVCYQPRYGWCLLNGKGHAHHEGHELPAPQVAPMLLKRNNRKPAPPSSSRKKPTPAAAASSADAVKNLYDAPSSPWFKTEEHHGAAVPCCASTTCSNTTEDSSSVLTHGTQDHFFPNIPDENVADYLAQNAAWKDLKQTSDCKVSPAYTDFALDPIYSMPSLGEDDDEMMNWDLLDDQEPSFVPNTASVPECTGGLLHKTVYLSEPPFPEVTELEDKVAGIMQALRNYASAHNFAVTEEDMDTVDKPGEKTLRVVLHCLGSGCCYQVALLWVVGLTRWNIYCQPDGIFVHGCSRLDRGEQQPSYACAATPLNQALEQLDDFLNGEVVCPDEGQQQQQQLPPQQQQQEPLPDDIPSVVAAAKQWGEKKKISENVRKETRKAVAKVAADADATASAA